MSPIAYGVAVAWVTGCAVFVAALGAPHFVLATMSIVTAVATAAVCGITVGRRDGARLSDRAAKSLRALSQSSGEYIAFLERRVEQLQPHERERHDAQSTRLQ